MSWVRAHIGLGSNLDQPVQQIQHAVVALGRMPRSTLVRCSRLYRSAPLGPQDQPDYVNAVAAVDTELAALDLLAALQQIEQQQGRIRLGKKWGPRTLDLDIVLYGDQQIRERDLVIPHPHAHERDFVLVPLLEIAPEAKIVGIGSVYDLIKTCPSNRLVSIEQAPL